MKKEKLFAQATAWSEHCLWGFIFFTPIGHAGASVCFGLLALCFLIRKSIHPDFAFLKRAEHLWLLVFFIFCTLSLLNSDLYLAKSIKSLVRKWGMFAMVFVFSRDMITGPEKLHRAGWAILAVAALIGFDGLIQQFRGTDVFYARPVLPIPPPYFHALTATFKNSNDFASYLALVTPIAISMTASAPFPRTRRALWILTPILCACLLLTFSRGAWVGFLAASLFMVILSRQWKMIVPALLLFAVPISLNFLILGDASIDLSFGTGKQTAAASGRSELWGMGWQLIRENPFLGKGIGTFMDYSGQRVTSVAANYAHNCYLQMWAESGVFSLLAFLLFLGTIFRKGIRSYSRTQDPLTLGLLCGLFAFLIHSAFDTQFYSVAQSFLLWSMLGILAAATDPVERGKATA